MNTPKKPKLLDACILSSLALLGACGTQEEQKKPNVLFIAVDDLRPELSCYGEKHVISPNIDRLAQNGIRFTNAYCQSAVSNPSRASLLTGLRPDATQVLDLHTYFRNTIPDAVTLPQYLMTQGYYTAAIGKIFHNTYPDTLSWSEPKMFIKGYPFDPDAVYRSEKANQYLDKRKEKIIAAGREKRHIDQFGEWYLKCFATECVDVPDNAYFDGAQTDVAIDKLEELSGKDEPFFFGVGYYRPHLPFNAPKKYWDLYDPESIPLAENNFVPENAPSMAINSMRELRGYADFKDETHPVFGQLTEEQSRHLKHGYLASVSYIDAQIGRLLDKLEDLGIMDNTIIVLWGDHGWKLGEHGSWCKMTNYQIDTRVPMIFCTPELKGKNVSCDEFVEFVDIFPTICDLCDVETPGQLEGISARPLFNDPDKKWKNAAFSQFLREGIWVGPDSLEYQGYAIRTHDYLYVEWLHHDSRDLAATELYDLKKDPQENKNVAAENAYKETLKELSARLKAGWEGALPKQ